MTCWSCSDFSRSNKRGSRTALCRTTNGQKVSPVQVTGPLPKKKLTRVPPFNIAQVPLSHLSTRNGISFKLSRQRRQGVRQQSRQQHLHGGDGLSRFGVGIPVPVLRNTTLLDLAVPVRRARLALGARCSAFGCFASCSCDSFQVHLSQEGSGGVKAGLEVEKRGVSLPSI